MSAPDPVRVVLHLDPAEQTIAGRLEANNAPAVPFFGWLELISALEGVLARPQVDRAPGAIADRGET